MRTYLRIFLLTPAIVRIYMRQSRKEEPLNERVETSRRLIVARLEADGWVFAREGGRHSIYKHPAREGRRIVVPRHNDLSIGVCRAIAKAAGWR